MARFLPLVQKNVPAPSVEAEPAIDTPEVPIDIVAERASAYDAGKRDGLAEAGPKIAELEARLALAKILGDEVERARRRALDTAAADIAAMVVALARKVIGDSLALHPDAVPEIVRAAIDRLPEEDELSIRVPAHAVERTRALVPERYRERVQGDATLNAGCVVETRFVSIERSLETAMQGIESATAAWLAGRT